MKDWLTKLYRGMLYILPVALFFSYYPVIRIGESESMNLELSIAMIWLVLFDVVLVANIIKKRKIGVMLSKWKWLPLPVFVTISLAWTLNPLRGTLTVGVMWAIVVAVVGIWAMRGEFDDKFRRRWWEWFYIATLALCGWCILQCILNLVGVPGEDVMLCQGCTYRTFGFPHPNGSAVEPQFMGNLLIAPIIVSFWANFCQSSGRMRSVLGMITAFVGTMTLFLVFSRGAIYATFVGLAVLSAVTIWRAKKRRAMAVKRVVVMMGVATFAFVVALNFQGLMAQLSPTNDTYKSGVAKVLSQLSLGVIDIRERGTAVPVGTADTQEQEAVAKVAPVEVSSNEPVDAVQPDAQASAFDGYVEESTEVRKQLTRQAVEIWRSEPRNMLFGVGMGGAGEALRRAGYYNTSKEIVQNEYANLLLEAGLVGVILAIVSLTMLYMMVRKQKSALVIVALAASYGVSLVFFSGFPNALQVYLMPVMIMAILSGEKNSQKEMAKKVDNRR